jgi:hypothetical protein
MREKTHDTRNMRGGARGAHLGSSVRNTPDEFKLNSLIFNTNR